MKEEIIVYFVAENGFMDIEMSNLFIDNFKSKGYSIIDIGMGNAYNIPLYLLGEIESHIEKAVVVSIRFDDNNPVPMVFFSRDEIDALTEELINSSSEENSFNIITAVHKKIRS